MARGAPIERLPGLSLTELPPLFHRQLRASQCAAKGQGGLARRGIAQSGSAEVLGTSGRRFESCCPDHQDPPARAPAQFGTYAISMHAPRGAAF